MLIDKTPVRVGDGTNLEPNSQLPMFRKFNTFEGSLDNEYILVYFDEWLESGTAKLERKTKHYIVKDVPEVGHFENFVLPDPEADPPVEFYEGDWVVDTPAYPAFSSGWFFRKVKATAQGLSIDGVIVAPLDYELDFGKDMVVAVINGILQELPFDVENGHIKQA